MSSTTTSPASLPQYYHYTPSVAAAGIALTCYLSTTLLHAFQMGWTRTWYWVPFLIGGVFEITGYVCRVSNAQKTPYWVNALYIVEQIGILVAPAFLAASMYMLFGRIIRLVEGDSRSLIRQKYQTGIFVAGDVLSLIIQSGGGGLAGNKNPDTAKLGTKIIDAGLFIQIFSFGTFLLCSLIFYHRITQRPTRASVTHERVWHKHIYTLWVTSCLIFGRCIFRVTMYLQGTDGSIERSEVLFYLFDFLFVFTVMVFFNVVHPSEVRALLNGEGRLAWGGSVEKRGSPLHQDESDLELNGSGMRPAYK